MRGADVTDVETEALKEAGRYHIPHKIPRWYWWRLDLRYVWPSWPVFTTLLRPTLEESRATPALPTLPHSFGAHVQIKTGFGGESLEQRCLYT